MLVWIYVCRISLCREPSVFIYLYMAYFNGAVNISEYIKQQKKLCGLSPRANYTDRATATCLRHRIIGWLKIMDWKLHERNHSVTFLGRGLWRTTRNLTLKTVGLQAVIQTSNLSCMDQNCTRLVVTFGEVAWNCVLHSERTRRTPIQNSVYFILIFMARNSRPQGIAPYRGEEVCAPIDPESYAGGSVSSL
jgi:hypothetical protein